MDQAARHAIVTCLTAILLLALLHGQRLADELEEKGFPPGCSSFVRSASDLSPARILEAMRVSANAVASLDRRPGQLADEEHGEQEQAGGLAVSGAFGTGKPEEQSRAEVKPFAEDNNLPSSKPAEENAISKTGIMSGTVGTQRPALATSHPLPAQLPTKTGRRMAMSHQPFGEATGHVPAGQKSQANIASLANKTAIGDQAGSAVKIPDQVEKKPDGTAISAETTKTARDGKRKSIFDRPLSRRYKVLLVGDSFMEDITLALMRNFYYKDPYVQYINVARHSTGLCISSKWNWRQKLAGFVSQHRPDVVMIYLGANDLQNIVDDGRRYSFTSDAWKKRYEEIAASLIDIAVSQKADVIWIGMPVMGIKPYETWMPLVSSLQRKACESRQVEYIDTVPTLADANGKYQVYMKDAKGQLVRIRKDDRYHVSYDGCLLILDQVLPSLKKYIMNREKKNVLSLPTGRK